MTDKPMNGAAVADDLPIAEELPSIDVNEAPAPVQQGPMSATQIIETSIAQAVGVTVRGLLVSCPGVPSGFILQKIAFACGKLLAVSIQGNPLETTVKARADFKRAFEDGMAKVSILQMGGTMTAQPGPDLRR